MCLSYDKPQCFFFLSVLRTNVCTWVIPRGWHRGGGARGHRKGILCCVASSRRPWIEGIPDSTKQKKESIWENLRFLRWLGLGYRESIVRSTYTWINGRKYELCTDPKESRRVGQTTNNMERAVLQAWTHFPLLIFIITPLSPSLASWLPCTSAGTAQWLKTGTARLRLTLTSVSSLQHTRAV